MITLSHQQLRCAGLVAAGILPAQSALFRQRQSDASRPTAASLLVALFPYYAGLGEGRPNLSLYARGIDYHIVVRRRLEEAAAQLGLSGVALVDTSPFDEVSLAARAGLGNIGFNGLLVSREWGSFCFIGTFLSQQELTPLSGGLTPGCIGCGICRAACPTDALSKNGRVTASRCLSALTQLRKIDEQQLALLPLGRLIWGCDLCQLCCPANAHPSLTQEPAFRQDLIHSLTIQQLEGLSSRAFVRQYRDRAFSWRGLTPLLRNLSYLHGRSSPSV